MACEMLCFTIETGAVGREGRSCEAAVAGYVRATFVWFRSITVVPEQFVGGFSLRRKRAGGNMLRPHPRSLSAVRHCPPCVRLDGALAASPHFVRRVSTLCPPYVRLASASKPCTP